jgi:hypothetical protein
MDKPPYSDTADPAPGGTVADVSTPESPPPLAGPLALYIGARIALMAAIAGVLLLFHIPLFVALAVGIVLAFPLSLLLLRDLNHRATAALAARAAIRQAERDRLRARLRGDDPA